MAKEDIIQISKGDLAVLMTVGVLPMISITQDFDLASVEEALNVSLEAIEDVNQIDELIKEGKKFFINDKEGEELRAEIVEMGKEILSASNDYFNIEARVYPDTMLKKESI